MKLEAVIGVFSRVTCANVSAHFELTAYIGFSQADTVGWRDAQSALWIEFAPSVEASDLPPLFVVTAEGAELVNYRLQAGRYLVDRVFDVGELRLGTRDQTIVRIERNPVAPAHSHAFRRGPHS